MDEKRIPQALGRKDGGLTSAQRKSKMDQIDIAGYARWIFIFLPGPLGSATPSKLYIFIDVVASGMDLESRPPRPRKPRKSAIGSGNEL